MTTENAPNESLYGVITNGQSYLNLIYLILSFPLGVFYFVFLAVGLSLGMSLSIILIGIPILLVILAASRVLVVFERWLAVGLLGADLPAVPRRAEPAPGIWARTRELLSNSATWKGIVYLFAKFPFGVFSFVVSVTLTSVTLALISAPLFYPVNGLEIGFWRVDTGEEALICLVLGLAIGIIALHIFNGLAFLWGRFTVWMLRAPDSVQLQTRTTGPIVIA